MRRHRRIDGEGGESRIVNCPGKRRTAAGHIRLAAVFLVLALCSSTGCGAKPGYHTEAEVVFDTVVTIKAWGTRDLKGAITEALGEVRSVQSVADAHSPDSEVSRLNASAGMEEIRISDDLHSILAAAQEVNRESGGAFDITVYPLSVLWSMREEKWVPADEEVKLAMTHVDSDGLRIWLQGFVPMARLSSEGMGVDLGAIAKGYAAKRAADALRRNGVDSALVDAGGDLYAIGKGPAGAPWKIAIKHPRRPDEYLGVVKMGEGAISTSGDYERFFEKEGVRYHHIIDPRTGYPAMESQSATVIGPCPMLADALSTAVFVLGPEEGLQLLSKYPGYHGLIVVSDGSIALSPGMERIFEPNVKR